MRLSSAQRRMVSVRLGHGHNSADNRSEHCSPKEGEKRAQPIPEHDVPDVMPGRAEGARSSATPVLIKPN